MIKKYINSVYQGDCLEFMRQLPDKCIDLCLTDPPYGINEDGGKDRTRGKQKVKHEKKGWDKDIPTKEVFEQIFRISKNQVIFGANYFVEHIKPSMGWIYWDKNMGGDFSDGELAYTSFKKALRSYKQHKNNNETQHPTQKPVELFVWILENYSKAGDLIFDPFAGSGTTGVACNKMVPSRNFILCEKEVDYCKIINNRISQQGLF